MASESHDDGVVIRRITARRTASDGVADQSQRPRPGFGFFFAG